MFEDLKRTSQSGWRGIIWPALFSLVILGFIFFGYKSYLLGKELRRTESDMRSAEAEIRDLNSQLQVAKGENEDLAANLTSEKNKNDQFENQIKDISSVVGTLEKWSQTDPELLQKYSKVYFLSENYTPEALAPIAEDYLHDKTRSHEIHAKVEPFLIDMLEEATKDDIDLRVVSAYRSFGTQSALKSGYQVIYGAGSANQFSADQGYSEHQLGTAVDFTVAGMMPFVNFDTTMAFKWLENNAHKYGFILSYPKGNNYYQYEPWHWRFVGEELVRDLRREGKRFYDMDQRALDPYLVKLFN